MATTPRTTFERLKFCRHKIGAITKVCSKFGHIWSRDKPAMSLQILLYAVGHTLYQGAEARYLASMRAPIMAQVCKPRSFELTRLLQLSAGSQTKQR